MWKGFNFFFVFSWHILDMFWFLLTIWQQIPKVVEKKKNTKQKSNFVNCFSKGSVSILTVPFMQQGSK